MAATLAVLLRSSGWLVLLGILGALGMAEAREIAVLKSASIAAYNQAIDGFKAALPDAVTFNEYDMQGDIARGRRQAQRIRASNAALVLAVGTKAALVAKLELVAIPVIFCMVLDPAQYRLNAPNMTGISLEVPIDRQFATVRTVLPNLRRIGVLYDPEKTTALVDEARQAAKALGLEMVARQVRSEKEVPATLRAIMPQIEALWLIPDSTVLTEDSLRFILGTTLDANVPVIGFSSELVRSGALLGLSVSYEDAGQQAGLLARKILYERAVPTAAAVAPERVRLALNLKTAKFLGITIPPEVVDRADELY
jgi:putative tryptophan/tyrosine transport system substrate-binding protein